MKSSYLTYKEAWGEAVRHAVTSPFSHEKSVEDFQPTDENDPREDKQQDLSAQYDAELTADLIYSDASKHDSSSSDLPLTEQSEEAEQPKVPETQRKVSDSKSEAKAALRDSISKYIASAQSIYEVMMIVQNMEKYSQDTVAHPELEALRGKDCAHSGLYWKTLPVSWEWVGLIKQAKEKVMEFVHKEESKPDSAMQFDQTVYDFLDAPTSRVYAFFHWHTGKAKSYMDICQHIQDHKMAINVGGH